MNTEERERGGERRGEQEGAGQPRDVPPQYVANEAAALQEHLVEPARELAERRPSVNTEGT